MPKILSDRDKVLKCKYGILEKQIILTEDKNKKTEETIIVSQSCLNSLGENKKEKWHDGQVECKVEKPEDCDSFKLIKGKKEK